MISKLGRVSVLTKTFPLPVFVADESSDARIYQCANDANKYTSNPALGSFELSDPALKTYSPNCQ